MLSQENKIVNTKPRKTIAGIDTVIIDTGCQYDISSHPQYIPSSQARIIRIDHGACLRQGPWQRTVYLYIHLSQYNNKKWGMGISGGINRYKKIIKAIEGKIRPLLDDYHNPIINLMDCMVIRHDIFIDYYYKNADNSRISKIFKEVSCSRNRERGGKNKKRWWYYDRRKRRSTTAYIGRKSAVIDCIYSKKQQLSDVKGISTPDCADIVRHEVRHKPQKIDRESLRYIFACMYVKTFRFLEEQKKKTEGTFSEKTIAIAITIPTITNRLTVNDAVRCNKRCFAGSG